MGRLELAMGYIGLKDFDCRFSCSPLVGKENVKPENTEQRKRTAAHQSGLHRSTLPLLCYLKHSKHQTGPDLRHKTGRGPLTILQQFCVYTRL